MSPDVDYYDVLDINPDASASEVKAAYRRAVRGVHPDVHGTAGLFRLAHEAYAVLSDPLQRVNYDRERTLGRPAADATTPAPDYVVEEWPPPAGDRNTPPDPDYVGYEWPTPDPEPGAPPGAEPWRTEPPAPAAASAHRAPTAPPWRIARWKLSRLLLALPLPATRPKKILAFVGWVTALSVISSAGGRNSFAQNFAVLVFSVSIVLLWLRALLAAGARIHRWRRR